jgi:hypothetical protein
VHVRLDPSFADADATLEASQVASRSEAALTIAVAGGGGESVTVSITREVEDCTVFDASFSVDGASFSDSGRSSECFAARWRRAARRGASVRARSGHARSAPACPDTRLCGHETLRRSAGPEPVGGYTRCDAVWL